MILLAYIVVTSSELLEGDESAMNQVNAGATPRTDRRVLPPWA